MKYVERYLSLSCLVCRSKPSSNRGVCDACYHRHGAAIRAGQTTWQQLEADGLSRQAGPTGQAWMRGFRINRKGA